MSDLYQQLVVHSRAEWREWLAANHETERGIWVVTFKKASGGPHDPFKDIVEEAMAHSWVDSQPRKIDAERSGRLVTSRRPTSSWSGHNKLRIARLEAAGLMASAGTAAINVAKANGAWFSLDEVEKLSEPEDPRAAVDVLPDARGNWDAFPRSARRGILEWIGAARTPQTRVARVGETARSAAVNVRANQWPRRKGV